MLSKTFKAGKCKTSVKLAVARIKLLRNKRDVQIKHMRKELAQLLESGQEQTARIRVEHVVREEKTMSAYDLIELYCELIAARLPIIESQKICPIDLKEAIASVIFASPRCADIPELMDIRKHFTTKYGKEFTNSALEVRPNCGVSHLVVEKLSARAPDVETKIKILTSVAQEHGVKWDSKAFEEELRKPNEDLLNGPSTFSSASKIPMEPSNVNHSSSINQTKGSSMPQNEAASRAAVAGTFSHTNSRTSSTSVSKASESIYGGGVQKAYSREENSSRNRPTWKMEFKDATSAAQAAADSAEMASMAARAAAELATRESLSRENSSVSNESPTYRVDNERPYVARGSKLRKDNSIEDPLSMGHDEMSRFQGMRPEIQNLQNEEVKQGVSRREARKKNEDFSSDEREASHSSPRSTQTRVSHGVSNVGPQKTNVKDYDRPLKMSSKSEAMEKNRESMKHENADHGRAYVGNFTESASLPDASTFNDESIQHPKFENDVVFDNYDSDVDDNISVFGSNKERFLPHRGEESSVSQTNIGLLSPRQHKSGSPSKVSSSRLHLFTESEEYSEKKNEVPLPLQSEENVPAMFDDSDGLSTESEDEKHSSTHTRAMRPSIFLHDQRSSRESFPEESNDKKKVKDITNSPMLPRGTDGYQQKHERQSYTDKSPGNSYDLWSDDISSDEDMEPLQSSNVQSLKRREAKEQLAPSSIKDSETSDKFSDENGQGLNYGRLTGGFKNRGFPRPPYVRNSAINDSYSSKQPSGETSSIPEIPTVSEVGKSSAVLDVLDHEFVNQDLHPKDSYSRLYDKNPTTKAPKSSSRRPVTYFDSDDGEAKLDSDFTSENKPSKDVKLSRRTRGMPSEGKSNALRFTGRSDAALTSQMEGKSFERISTASEPHSDAVHDEMNIYGKGTPKALQPNPPSGRTSPRHSSTERVANDGYYTKSSNTTSGSISHENSVKNTPHTHPKLPDYDNLAAHFRSLRSNRG